MLVDVLTANVISLFNNCGAQYETTRKYGYGVEIAIVSLFNLVLSPFKYKLTINIPYVGRKKAFQVPNNFYIKKQKNNL